MANIRQANIEGPPSEEYLGRLLPFVLDQKGFEVPGITDVPLGGSGRRTHIAQAGDTFSALALEYGLSVDELRRLNPGVADRGIQIGQQLITGVGTGPVDHFGRAGEIGLSSGVPFVESGIDTDLDVPDTSVEETKLAGLVAEAQAYSDLIDVLAEKTINAEVEGDEEVQELRENIEYLVAQANQPITQTYKLVYEEEGTPPRSNLVGKVGGIGLGGGSGFRSEQGS